MSTLATKPIADLSISESVYDTTRDEFRVVIDKVESPHTDALWILFDDGGTWSVGSHQVVTVDLPKVYR